MCSTFSKLRLLNSSASDTCCFGSLDRQARVSLHNASDTCCFGNPNGQARVSLHNASDTCCFGNPNGQARVSLHSASDTCCFGSVDKQARVSFRESCEPVSTFELPIAPGMRRGDVEMLGALISQDMHFHCAQSKIYFGRMLCVLGELQLLVTREDLLVSGIPNRNVCSSSHLWIRNLLNVLVVVSECCPLFTKEGSSCFRSIIHILIQV